MLSVEENEILTRTDRGTPMGELFRRFWIPVLLAAEIPYADCEPVRFKVLGEDLVAFRDSDGRPGVLDAFCPHRGAVLSFGRNEECGLRCLYHGWKFDVDGNCVDLPNIPNGEFVKGRMRTIAYPVVEKAGLIWAYMGPAERKPPMPELPYLDVPLENVYVTKYEIDCNYLQALEGDLDPTHGQFLHSSLARGTDPVAALREQNYQRNAKTVLPDVCLLEDTPAGVVRGTCRTFDDGKVVVTAQQTILPTFTSAGLASPGTFSTNIRVPIDDESEWHFRLRWAPRALTEHEIATYKYEGFAFAEHELGGWRPKANKSNGYLQDRLVQKQFNYTGVTNFPNQDVMMIEDQWGPIADRSREHLVAADRVIIHHRKRLLKLALSLAEGNEPEEPFRLKGLRQEVKMREVPVQTNRLDEEMKQAIYAELNISSGVSAGRDSHLLTDRIWEASLEPEASVEPDASMNPVIAE
jgi:phthalate 4,5-dioxygenase